MTEPVAWQWRVGRSAEDWKDWEPKTEKTKAAAEALIASYSFVHTQIRPLYALDEALLYAALAELCEEAKDSLFDATPLQSFLDAIARAEKALGYKPLPGRLESTS